MFCLKKILPPKFIAKIADHLPLDDVVADTNQTSKYVEILRAQELSWHIFLKYCCESYHGRNRETEARRTMLPLDSVYLQMCLFSFIRGENHAKPLRLAQSKLQD